MVQNFQDESCFILSTLKAETGAGYHVILKWIPKKLSGWRLRLNAVQWEYWAASEQTPGALVSV